MSRAHLPVPIIDSVRCPVCKQLWLDKVDHIKQKHKIIYCYHLMKQSIIAFKHWRTSRIGN